MKQKQNYSDLRVGRGEDSWFVRTPQLFHISQIESFDRETLLRNPCWEGFNRLCFDFELPPGVFDELRQCGEVFVFIKRTNPSGLGKLVFTSLGRTKSGCPTLPVVVSEGNAWNGAIAESMILPCQKALTVSSCSR
jgi:hypothetical protein